MPKIACRVSPFVNVCVPLARKDLSQTELVRSMIFLVRFVPWRPENKRQRAMPPDHVEIIHGEILLSPIARRSDDGLMFSHHVLKILDRLQGDIILSISEIHEGTGVTAVLRNSHLYG